MGTVVALLPAAAQRASSPSPFTCVRADVWMCACVPSFGAFVLAAWLVPCLCRMMNCFQGLRLFRFPFRVFFGPRAPLAEEREEVGRAPVLLLREALILRLHLPHYFDGALCVWEAMERDTATARMP